MSTDIQYFKIVYIFKTNLYKYDNKLSFPHYTAIIYI